MQLFRFFIAYLNIKESRKHFPLPHFQPYNPPFSPSFIEQIKKTQKGYKQQKNEYLNSTHSFVLFIALTSREPFYFSQLRLVGSIDCTTISLCLAFCSTLVATCATSLGESLENKGSTVKLSSGETSSPVSE